MKRIKGTKQIDAVMSHANVKEGKLTGLQKDNVFVTAETKPLDEIAGYPVANKCAKAIISEGKIVSVVSNDYGFLSNEAYFLEIERALMEADIEYETRSINRDNSHFAVDYILCDDRFQVDVKGGTADKIRPMIRATNSYAGGPTSGRFGFFREVCANGLHVAEMKAGFGVRHKSTITSIVLPEIKSLVEQFTSNEYYELRRKFDVLAERKITNLEEWVKYTCTELDLFKFEKSEKNPDEMSKNAQFIIDLVNVEANAISASDINVWLGYNAFNQFIHQSGKSFTEQRNLDRQLFNFVTETSN